MRVAVVLAASTALALGGSTLPAGAAEPAVDLPPPAQGRVDTPEAHAHEDRVFHDQATEARLRRHTRDATAADAAAAVAATAGPRQEVGEWTAPVPWPVVAVHTTLLPDGKVLSYDSVGDKATEAYAVHDHTRATVWDPATGAHTDVTVRLGYNIFCSGLAHLPDGSVFLAGGNKDSGLNGIRQTTTFDPGALTWTGGPDMAFERWYPSVTAMPNGEILITEGGPDVPEVRGTDGRLRSLTTASLGMPLYPWLDVAPDGRAFYSGPDNRMLALDASGTGSWQSLGAGDGSRDYGSRAMYDVGKVLVTGGAASRRDAAVIDITRATPVRTATASMASGRRQHNVTVLADGSVLATGGNSSGAGLVDLANGVYAAERWDPATGTWKTLAAQTQTRQYHSTATLLPDGRVLSGGGGICGTCDEVGYLAKDAEVFSPPYLFDATGNPARRPSLSSPPGPIPYAAPVTLSTPDASSISKVGLVRLGAVTHSVDMEQRYVPLTFTAGAGTLSVTGPAGPNTAPPGIYLLFLVDSAGVPSVASMVDVGAAAPDVHLTSPTSGATFTAPATVDLAATATDAHGVARVEFFQGTTEIGEDTTAPYTYAWSGVGAGSYTLTARATDNRGVAATSPAATIRVDAATANTAPTARITQPAAGATIRRRDGVTITVEASDSDGTVAKVEFFRDGGTTKLGEDTTAPYAHTWKNPPTGSHTLVARATDDRGAVGTSEPVSITVRR